MQSCKLNSSVVYDKILVTLSLAVSEPKAKRKWACPIDRISALRAKRELGLTSFRLHQ
jgi:hypothetical protein